MYTVTLKMTKEMQEFLSQFTKEIKLNRTKIEWADYTWNPIVGCKHNCSYCYARRLNDRFKWIESWTKPKFFPERIEQMLRAKVSMPKKRNRIAQQISPDKPLVFVGSMCDLWGEWVPEKWINDVIDVAKKRKDVNFAFLTKNPRRYLEYAHELTNNMFFGHTCTGEQFTSMKWMWHLKYDNKKAIKTFVSIEPILNEFRWVNLRFYDFVIVGAMTGAGAIKPKREWIDSIQHERVYYKDNILEYIERKEK